MQAYLALADSDNNEVKDLLQIDDSSWGNDPKRATPVKLGKMLKAFKAHRCALDFDLQLMRL